MIPKKIRRTIKLDGVEYEYCVTGCTTIYIKNLTTNKTVEKYYDNKWKWLVQIKPDDIVQLIYDNNL